MKIRAAIVVVLLIALWTAAAPYLAERLVVRREPDRADAILVLGGSAAFRERTALAAALFANGVAPRIVLTNDGGRGGWDRAEQRNPFFYELAKRNLVAHGVPPDAIEVLPEPVSGTYDEALLFSRAARERGFGTVLIVTSPFHTRRALRTFESVGGAEYGIVSTEYRAEPFWWLKPSGWRDVGAEYLKLGYYSVSFRN